MEDAIFTYADPAAPAVKRNLIRLVEAATGQRRLKKIYMDHRRHPVPSESFFQSAVRRLALTVLYDAAALDAVPKQGATVVVANHPYGVLDGIVIAWLVEKARKDFLILTNAVLLRAPELQPYVLPVDFAATDEATRTNLASRAIARDHLARGGCVVVFPAGGVSTAPDRLGRKPAVDSPWQPFTAQLIQRAKATVVPVCFKGQNSRLFQVASHLSQTLRVSLIFREVRNRIGTELPVAIGAPIPYAELSGARDRQDLAADLMRRTYALQIAWPAVEPRGSRLSLPDLASRLRALPERRARSRARDATRRDQPRPR